MQVLGDLKFLESLKLFDKENIPVPIIRKIREKYITNPDFHPSLIKNVSSACEGLCSWVRAIEVYDRVAKVTVSFLNCVIKLRNSNGTVLFKGALLWAGILSGHVACAWGKCYV